MRIYVCVDMCMLFLNRHLAEAMSCSNESLLLCPGWCSSFKDLDGWGSCAQGE